MLICKLKVMNTAIPGPADTTPGCPGQAMDRRGQPSQGALLGEPVPSLTSAHFFLARYVPFSRHKLLTFCAPSKEEPSHNLGYKVAPHRLQKPFMRASQSLLSNSEMDANIKSSKDRSPKRKYLPPAGSCMTVQPWLTFLEGMGKHRSVTAPLERAWRGQHCGVVG